MQPDDASLPDWLWQAADALDGPAIPWHDPDAVTRALGRIGDGAPKAAIDQAAASLTVVADQWDRDFPDEASVRHHGRAMLALHAVAVRDLPPNDAASCAWLALRALRERYEAALAGNHDRALLERAISLASGAVEARPVNRATWLALDEGLLAASALHDITGNVRSLLVLRDLSRNLVTDRSRVRGPRAAVVQLAAEVLAYRATRAPEDLSRAIALGTSARQRARSGPLAARARHLHGRALDFAFDVSGRGSDLDRAITAFRSTLTHAGDAPRTQAFVLHSLGVSLSSRHQATGDAEALDAAVDMFGRGLAILPTRHPDRPRQLGNVASSLSTRYRLRGDPADIDRALALAEEALAPTPADSPDRPRRLGNLASRLSTRHDLRGDPADLDRSLALAEEALALTPTDSPSRASRLNTLSIRLSTRYDLRGDPRDLDRALALAEEALALTPTDSPSRASRLNTLSIRLSTRYDLRGDPADLDRALALAEEALALTPADSPDRARRLGNLANRLSTRYDLRGDPADLDRALQLEEEALALTPKDSPDRARRLGNLAISLSTRYNLRSDPADLDRALALAEEALALTPKDSTDRPERLGNLAISLSTRYELRSDPADLDRALALDEEALALTPADNTDRPQRLGNLAISLSTRYDLRSDPADLDRALQLEEEALALTPKDSPDRARRLGNLAISLSTRHDLRGDPRDLDRALALEEEALALTPKDSTSRASRLNTLSIRLSTRYDLRGDPADLDRALALAEEALALTPKDSTSRASRLGNLAISLSTRYELRSDPADLDRALALSEEALALTPKDSPDRASRLNTLAIRLSTRYDLRGDPADLDRSLALAEEALALTPVVSPDRPLRLGNLAIRLSTRYRLRGEPRDLDRALALEEEALALTPVVSPDRARRLHNLSIRLSTRYDLHRDPADLDSAIILAEEAVICTPENSTAFPLRLNGLATRLRQRYSRDRQPADLDRSIELGTRVIASTPEASRSKALRLRDQAIRLNTRYTLARNPSDLHTARTLARQAWEESKAVTSLERIEIGKALVRILRRRGRTATRTEQIEVLRTALDLLEAFLSRLSLTDESLARAVVADNTEIQLWLVTTLADEATTAARRGDSEAYRSLATRAFIAVERSKGRYLAAQLEAGAVQPGSEAAPLVARLRQLSVELSRLEGLLGASDAGRAPEDDDFPAPLGDLAQHPVTEAPDPEPYFRSSVPLSILRSRYDACVAEFDRVRIALSKSDPSFAIAKGFADPHPVNEIVAALPPRSSIIAFFEAGTRVIAVTVSPELAPRTPTPNDFISSDASQPRIPFLIDVISLANPKAAITSMNSAISALNSGRDDGDASRHHMVLDITLRRISESLLHPLLHLVMADPERLGEAPSPQRSPDDGELPKLVVIPSGSLHRVPFHALPLPFSRRPEWHAGTRLCDAFAVSYAAIADLLPFTSARGSSTTGLTTFAPGVAETPGGAGPERTVAMAAALASLSGSVSYLRAEATHDALLSAGCLAGAQVAIVATHGRAGTSFGPSRSGLLVHPGTTVPTQREPSRPAGTWVTTAEITSLLPLHLTGHLQLLACSTHADDPQPGDHLVGLLTALIVRGSRSVGATLWNVHEVPAILVGWLIGSSDAPPQTALLAAVGWLRIATVSDILHVVTEIQSRAITVLPPDDPACAVMRSTIHSLASIPQDSVPFHRPFSWAPFVLHGLPA